MVFSFWCRRGRLTFDTLSTLSTQDGIDSSVEGAPVDDPAVLNGGEGVKICLKFGSMHLVRLVVVVVRCPSMVGCRGGGRYVEGDCKISFFQDAL